ncbi:MAG: Holliday junction branch migration protein RuvA [Candidatus Absconditabacteria bacterium]
MFNFFNGSLFEVNNRKYLKNDFFGIEVLYEGVKSNGEYYIYSYLDDNTKSFKYFAFDTVNQKVFFEDLLKLPGIGPKVSFHISSVPQVSLRAAVESFDIKFFQALPGVGPKIAKRLLVELKNTVKDEDLNKISQDEKLFKDICGTVNSLGYDSKLIKKTLNKCPIDLKQENISQIIKWLIVNM